MRGKYVIVQIDTPSIDSDYRRVRLNPPEVFDDNEEKLATKFPKSSEDENLIKTALKNNDFLSKIITDGKRLNDIVESMHNKEVKVNEIIIQEGDTGSHMYISSKGRFQISKKGKIIEQFDDVKVFGELAILYNANRQATIKALTNGIVWLLDRRVFQKVMLQSNAEEQEEKMKFLQQVKKLNTVNKDVLLHVASLLKTEFFVSGEEIVRQGDKADKFYIISAGCVTVTKKNEGEVKKLGKGEYFGELALLKEDSRQATVTAEAPGIECLTLTRKEFISHFGEVENIESIQIKKISDSVMKKPQNVTNIDFKELKIVKTLGVGGFGRVELVRSNKKKEQVFALKYLIKINIVKQHQQQYVYSERNIQISCESPFIVRLYQTYKNNKYVFFLMEPCLGGDLWRLLQRQPYRRFEDHHAKFIAACVLQSLEYLHRRGIIYRDLKPENLLIDKHGYIKLADFGVSKKLAPGQRTNSFVGSAEYIAPEMLKTKDYNRSVDYWAFGIFIFELLTGKTPFKTNDSTQKQTYDKILLGIDKVRFPNFVSSSGTNIIMKLCRLEPNERLGMKINGIEDIKTHKWFVKFDWLKLIKCKLSSPFKPKLSSSFDTRHFPKFNKDIIDPEEETSGWDKDF